jgi:anti-sigma28 factor (negative regulator of flagellin synthesis)
MASNEGYSNLAAAILAFLGGRQKAKNQRRMMDEENSRMDAREERSFQRQLQLEKERALREDSRFGREMDFKMESLDRLKPKKGIADYVVDFLKGPSYADQLAQENVTSAKLKNKLLDRAITTGPQFPTNNGITLTPKGEVTFKPAKAPKTPKAATPKDPAKARAQELLNQKKEVDAFVQKFENVTSRKLIAKIAPAIENGEAVEFDTPEKLADAYIEELRARGKESEAAIAELNYNDIVASLKINWPKKKWFWQRSSGS